jgi:hypothetical protein
MKDYIKELCFNRNIRPVFTENKITILSNGSQNSIPVLRIHKIFKGCSKKTAQAIVNYYLDPENREKYIKQIQKLTTKKLGSGKYKITPLSDNFINAFILNNSFGEGDKDFRFILMERPIFSVTQKDFSGNHPTEITDGIIKVQDDNLIELDIIVDQ